MYHRIYLHIVWTTRDRAPVIDADLAKFLCRFLRAVARKERAYILEIGMVQTHVHTLTRIHPTQNVSRLVQRLKALSATVSNKEHRSDGGDLLYWAKGYSVKTVGLDGLDQVRAYLRHQPNHHPAEAIQGWLGDVNAEFDESCPRTLIPHKDRPT